MIPLLNPAERAALATRFPAWQGLPERDALFRSVTFGDFRQAFAFMTQVAMLAERADHHPEWCNIYNRVDITLSTHDCGGLSQRDLAMAEAIDKILAP